MVNSASSKHRVHTGIFSFQAQAHHSIALASLRAQFVWLYMNCSIAYRSTAYFTFFDCCCCCVKHTSVILNIVGLLPVTLEKYVQRHEPIIHALFHTFLCFFLFHSPSSVRTPLRRLVRYALSINAPAFNCFMMHYYYVNDCDDAMADKCDN